MQACHLVSSSQKATTAASQEALTIDKPTRHMIVTAMIGDALVGYQVHKTPDARIRLESLTNMAQSLGDLTEFDAAVVAKLLAQLPATANTGATR
ncbi:hypothetical protein [Pseudomonas sp. UC 17F4]|uniref:hypothetical protein n=1 Tax=Pseudomonas sp. UC 17F4 TaxID=1855328 RepID=UPI000B88B020|nr:hypothetical protein [Pseudomonas sp. UC 17F4]